MRSSWHTHILIGRIVVGLLIAFAGSADETPPGVPAAGLDLNRLARIVIADDAHAIEQSTAHMLAEGLGRVYARPEVGAEPAPPGTPTLFLGRGAALASGMMTLEELLGVGRGGHVIRTANGNMAIAGKTGADTAYGVERLLERLGFRFYPDVNGFFRENAQAVVPFPAEDGRLPVLNIEEAPALIFRTSHSHGMGEWADASALLREEIDAKTDLWIDHSAGYLVPKDLFYDEHPEYFAMTKDGERIAKDGFSYHRTPLCLSNPDVTRISIERALRWVEAQADRTFFPISYGDTSLWCECAECLALDPAPGDYATRLLHWVNPVARAIREAAPEKIVVCFGYGGSGAPPEGVTLEENIHIMRAIPFAGLVSFDHAVASRHKAYTDTVAAIEGWQKLAPGRVGVCEYFGGVYYPSLIDHIQGVVRAYVELGLDAVYFTYGRPRNFAGVWAYVYRQMLWDPTRDAMALAREYVTHAYPATETASAILDYLDLCHQRYQATIGDELDGRSYPTPITYYESEFVEKALAALERIGDRNETKNFILNWMAHPVTYELDAAGRDLIRRQCDHLLVLAGEGPKAWAATLGDLRQTVGLAERAQAGAGKVIEEWIKNQFPQP